MPEKRKILVTAALPYANNSLHLGHTLEYIQADIWVRFQRARGNECWFACASDGHGTPVMLSAERENVTPETLLARFYAEHREVFSRFGISVDNYMTTHSDENREVTAEIYSRLRDNDHILRRTIKQAFDDARQIFLPDRYIKGTCPKCDAPEQYGDSCENCGAAYAPMDLQDPVSILSGTKPSIRDSEHLFLNLPAFEAVLTDWVSQHVEPSLARKLDEWFRAGLMEWDISRDPPYFGFEIPDEPGKYFYVWFDALIGYVSSFLNLCRARGIDFDAFWRTGEGTEVYHFIGKDILYFHALYWPAMLHGAGFRTPSGLFTHGFLTVDGQKMSKRRGTFVPASKFADHVDPEYLRYYYAAKLGPAPEDIDLNPTDIVAKVNADLVGKYVNIASRCAGFLRRLGDNQLTADLQAPELQARFAAAAPEIAADFEALRYAHAIRRIMALADLANQYIDEHKPWQLAKDPAQHDRVLAVCSQGINLFRLLSIFLKPVVPALVSRAEHFLAAGELDWAGVDAPLLGHKVNDFSPLLARLEQQQITNVFTPEESAVTEATREPASPAAAAPGTDESQVDISQFMQLDLRIARVTDARLVDGADKLLQLTLDVGGTQKTVFSGIRSAYDPATLVGRQVVYLANLKPRKMRFGISEGMVLAASGDSPGVFLLAVDEGAEPGMRVT